MEFKDAQVIMQIEHVDAVRDIEQIVEAPGIDALLLGNAAKAIVKRLDFSG